MPSLRKFQFSQGSPGWSPVYSCLQTERNLERSPFKEEKVSHVSRLTMYLLTIVERGDTEFVTPFFCSADSRGEEWGAQLIAV